MPVKLGGSAGSNPPLIPDVLLTVSTTWSPPYKVKALVRVFGAGGGGGICNTRGGGISNSYLWAATGGGAGEHAGSILELDPSVTYTIVAGAGGAKKSRNSDGGATGNAGGLSRFSGSDITTITANGGGGGLVTQFEVIANAGTRSGAAGGTGGAGELYCYTGGAAGSITKPANALVSNVCILTGGGSVGIFNTGFPSGSVTFFTGASDRTIASGGGGVNGAGGNVTADTVAGRATWGGSTFGPGGNNDYYSAPGFGLASHLSPAPVYPDTDAYEATIDFWNGGSLMQRINHTFTTTEKTMSPPGSGGKGCTTNDSNDAWSSGANLFGGGGGWATYGGGMGSNWQFMAGGKIGGGGGAGGMAAHSGSIPAYSGMGGQGCVLIEMLERIA